LKACPQRFYIKYILGIRPIESTDSQRVGNVWHGCLEIIGKADEVERDDLLCAYLNKAYKERPVYKTPEEWETERVTILYALAGYRWFYTNQEHEVLYTEIPFEIPIRDPETGRVLPDCCLIGKIDKIIRLPNGVCCIKEHKTTGSSIDSASTVWSRLRLNTQKKTYILAAQKLQQEGIIDCGDQLINSCFYDYFHKPGISPKKLTQADSKKFIEDGEYCGQKFNIAAQCKNITDGEIAVNNTLIEYEPGKKEGTFAIRETPEMFGARLLQDMTIKPEFYFASREINCSADEIKQFEYELFNILRNVRYMKKYKSFYTVESQCEATFKCSYIPFCYNGIMEPDVNKLLNGFKHIFGDKNNGTKI